MATLSGVYIVGPLEGCYKIGMSGDVPKRLIALQTMTPVPFQVVHTITTDSPAWLEQRLHLAFAHCRTRGEWFRLREEDVELLCKTTSVNTTDKTLPSWSYTGTFSLPHLGVCVG